MSSARSSASILLTLARPGVVSMASESLLLLLFQAAFHCSGVCSFLQGFGLVFPAFSPRADRMSRYFCWYFYAALVQSSHERGSVLLMTAVNKPGFRPLLNQSSTIWSWRLYPAILASLLNLAMYVSSLPLSILRVRNSAFAFCRLIVSVNAVLKESITVSYRCSLFFPAPANNRLPSHPTCEIAHSWTSGPLMKVRKSITQEKGCCIMSCAPLSNL